MPTNIYGLFSGDYGYENIKNINLTNTAVDYVYYMWEWFCNSLQLERITFDKNWNTSRLLDIDYMFARCPKLKTLDLSGWDVSNCNNFEGMFNMEYLEDSGYEGEVYLKTLNLTNWVIDENASVDGMFTDCYSLKTIYLPRNINGLTIDLPEDNKYYFVGSSAEEDQEGEETTLSDTGSGYSVLQLNGTVYPSFPNTGVGVDIILPSAMILTLTVAICVVAFGGKKKKIIVK